MTLKLKKSFAANAAVDEYDVRQMKKVLNRLGYYTPYEETGITGIPDADIFTALKSFQKDQGLRATGTAKPDDETILKLQRAAARTESGYYIWRCVDDDKVRAGHAALNGTLRQFADSRDPGEDFNCRCWAEHVPDPYTDAIYPSMSPLDLIGGGVLLKGAAGTATRIMTSPLRDTKWITHASKQQLQKKFKHAKVFGIKGNQNNQTLTAYQKALENHVKSADTRVIKGTYRRNDVTHYYNPKTRINIMRDKNGEFTSGWKLKKVQHEYMMKNGKIGGGK